MQMEWSETLASGSPEIDIQHKELIQRINDLLAAMHKGGVGRDEVIKVVQYLSEYVVFHFGTEEQHMDHYKYSNTSAHKAQHAQFVKVFQKLKERLLRDGITPPLQQETKELVVDWLVNHIKFSDRALGTFLRLKS